MKNIAKGNIFGFVSFRVDARLNLKKSVLQLSDILKSLPLQKILADHYFFFLHKGSTGRRNLLGGREDSDFYRNLRDGSASVLRKSPTAAYPLFLKRIGCGCAQII